MSVKIEKTEKSTVKLDFSVDAVAFEEAINGAYKKLVKQINVAGFRKGKAPKSIIEKTYGKAVFYEEAINIVLPTAYEAAVLDSGISPVAPPEIDVSDVSENGVSFTAIVTVKPEFELGAYKGIEIEKVQYKVYEKDVKEELEKMREKGARQITVDDRSVCKNDIVTIDFEGFIDDIPFAGGKGENFELTIGSGQFIPGFEEQLIGKNLNDETTVNVTFPEEYHASEMAGKPAVFKVKVNQIQQKELPELDDEFAKDVSEFDSLDELKASIKAKMKEDNTNKAKNELESKILDKISETTEIDIPDAMIQNRIDELLREFEMQMQYQGMNLELYLNYTGTTKEELENQFKERATSQVKTSLILEQIAKAENIKASEKEINAELENIAKENNMSVEDVKNYVKDSDVESSLSSKKTIEFLVKEAVLVKASETEKE